MLWGSKGNLNIFIDNYTVYDYKSNVFSDNIFTTHEILQTCHEFVYRYGDT